MYSHAYIKKVCVLRYHCIYQAHCAEFCPKIVNFFIVSRVIKKRIITRKKQTGLLRAHLHVGAEQL